MTQLPNETRTEISGAFQLVMVRELTGDRTKHIGWLCSIYPSPNGQIPLRRKLVTTEQQAATFFAKTLKSLEKQ